MKALIYKTGGEFDVEERPDPVAGPQQLLVRPLFAGICFTDKHLYDGIEIIPGLPLNIVGGHEFSAEIVAVGHGTEGWQPGEVVSVDPRIYCGECDHCRAGMASACLAGLQLLGITANGGIGELCAIPANSAFRVPKGVTPLQAACVEPACCATRALRNETAVIGDNVVVIGIEDFNLFAIQWLSRMGARIIAVDPLEVRRTAATDSGAHTVLNPNQSNVESEIRRVMPYGADVVYVSTEVYVGESTRYLDLAFNAARLGARVVLMRSYSNPFRNSNYILPIFKELKISYFGNHFGNEPWRGGRPRGDWQATLDAMASGHLSSPPPGSQVVPFRSMVSHSDVKRIFRSLPAGAPKIVFDMTAGR